ncbi:MAG: M56 family metallopeptidase [Deltaproteobacteria bacterium]|nr:M56 family metallopeptidase [Deltaproteobacteria bacterium]
MSALASIILAFSFTAATALWGYYGLPGLIEATSGFTELCQSLFARCLEYYEIITFIAMWLGAALLASGLLYSLIRNSLRTVQSYYAVSRLPVRSKKSPVVLIDDLSEAAFTHGIFRPRIYLTLGLLKGLDKDELRAVFLHELHHKRERDPLRLLLLSFFRDLFFYAPVVKDIAANLKIKMEHASDDAAAKKEGERLVLASALIKVARGNYSAFVPSITGNSQVSARVRRLVDGKEPRFSRPTSRAVVLSVAAAAFLAFSLAYPVGAKTMDHECTLKQCSVHVDKVAKCREHCDAHDTRSRHAH